MADDSPDDPLDDPLDDPKIVELARMGLSPEHAEVLLSGAYPKLTPEQVREAVRRALEGGEG